MKKMNKKGFTLAELLIVIAIIAVLIAIAIPTFSGALDNARRQTDHANIRAAYSVMQVAKLTGKIETTDVSTLTSTTEWIMQKDGSFKIGGGSNYTLKADGDSSCNDCAGCDGLNTAVGATSSHSKTKTIVIVYTVPASGDPTWDIVLK